jgi:acyl-CoA reductase-like NAD-dependent aldehyde dehydrogenase
MRATCNAPTRMLVQRSIYEHALDVAAAVAKEEIFCPVLSIIPFDTEEEAVAIANDTAYGLTNYVPTTDPERARRVIRRLRSGNVKMNGQSHAASTPFGGHGQSGNSREASTSGLEEYLEVKSANDWNQAWNRIPPGSTKPTDARNARWPPSGTVNVEAISEGI